VFGGKWRTEKSVAIRLQSAATAGIQV